MPSSELIWTITGFALTVLIFSYLFGDNPLFRLTSYLFVGVAAGYAAVLVIYQVLLPRLIFPLLQGDPTERIIAVLALLGSLLLLFKLFPRFSRLGSLPMAYLVGAGAAVMIGGVVLGTLVGQTNAAAAAFDLQAGAATGRNPLFQLAEGAILLVGTISSLLYFQFGAAARPNQAPQRARLVEFGARIGQVFIAITLGALFAGVFATALTALINRLDFIANLFLGNF